MGYGTATITMQDGWLEILCPYEPDWIAALKQAIPSPQRQWDPGERRWRVDPKHRADVLALCEEWFARVIDHTAESAPGQSRSEQTSRMTPDPLTANFALLWLLPSAPEPIVRAVYRASALLYHPDMVGGDTEKMQQINLAYASICQRKGWRP